MPNLLKNKISFIYFALFAFCISISTTYAQSLDEFMEAQMVERKIPGIQLAVIKDGEVIKMANYGIANIQDNIATTSDTVFPLNSITKAFVGVAVMQLVEQDKLDLNASPAKYLPNLPVAWHDVTILQLFTHISGLPEMMRGDASLITVGGQDAAWELVQTLPNEFEPGENFRYNQTNLAVIGKIIEAVSGQPFVEHIIEHQLKEVGMPKTIQAGFTHFEGIVPNQARNYTYYKGNKLTTVTVEEFPPILRTAAGMSSNTTEIAKWLNALNNGVLLSKESLNTLWTPGRLNNGKTAGFNNFVNGYGIGWPIIVRPEHRAAIAIGGNRTAFAVYPDDDLSVIILTNLMGGLPDTFIDEVAGYYIPEMKIENGFDLSDDLNRLRIELDQKGYDNASEIAKNMQLSFVEAEINAWGYKLINALQKQKAVEIFTLNTKLFPKSANTYDSLADSYARLGNKERAIKLYEKVLALQPDNGNAPNQLNRLQEQ